jgi:two-component system KDP operon response regulator KdpE
VNITAPEHPISVLVIDDEPQMQRLLTVTLEASGYRVTIAENGRQGIATAAQRQHDVIILDLGLPDVNGISVLRQFRDWSQAPVIILSVHDAEAEKIEALDNGADDFVTKPFNTGELLARVRATLRRADRGRHDEPAFETGNIRVDFVTRLVTRNGQTVRLTAKEFALLRLFIQHAGKVLTHRHILREIWGPDHETQTQYLRVYITRLRDKLETNPTEPTLFVTEPGIGYRLADN